MFFSENISKSTEKPTEYRVTSLDIKFICFCFALLFYVHGKHLRSCRDGQLT